MLHIPLAPAGSLQRLFCIGAHGDDLEIGCAGTVAALRARHPGLVVTWVVLTSTPERAAEATAAARDLLGTDPRHAIEIRDFRDGYLPAMAADVKSLLHDLAGRAEPELVLCHHRGDLHQDHRLIGELAWQVFRSQTIWEYEIPKYDGDLGRPNLFVPLDDDQVERKIQLLLRHFRSQASKPWFSPETFRALLRLRGMEAGVRWAEAFHVAKTIIAP